MKLKQSKVILNPRRKRKKGNNYGYSTGKIHLTGKKAWEIRSVDADEIINSYINSAIPID